MPAKASTQPKNASFAAFLIKAAAHLTIKTTAIKTSAAEMGKVMGAATKQLVGKADGKAISAAVKELLSRKL